MKKLSLLIFVVCASMQLRAQNVPDLIRTTPVPISGANKNNRATVDANLKALLSLNIPRAASFTLNGAKDSIGYIMFNTTSNRFGVYRGGGVWDTYLITADITNFALDANVVHKTGNEPDIAGAKGFLGVQTVTNPNHNFITNNGNSIEFTVNGVTDAVVTGNNGWKFNGTNNIFNNLQITTAPSTNTDAVRLGDLGNYLHKIGETSQNIEGDINLVSASSLLTAHQIRSIGNGSGWSTLGDWQLLFSDVPGGRGRQFELSKGNNSPTLIYSKDTIKIDNGSPVAGITILGNNIKDYNGNYFLKGTTGYTPANDINVIHNQNILAETANSWINGSATSLTQSLSNGTNNYTSYLGSIGGVAGQPIFGSDAGYYAFQSSTPNTPPRFYLLPKGSPTGLTSKFEMFTTDYVANTTFYTGLNIILDNTTNTINFGANRSAGSSPTRLQTIIAGDYVGSVIQAASPFMKLNIDNSMDLYAATLNQTSAGRINFTVNTNVAIGNWNSNGLGIGDNTQTYLYPLDVIKSVTGGSIARVKNATAGTGNFGRFIVEGDGANGIVLTAFASNFTTSGANLASGGSVTGGNTGGLSVGATNAAGVLRFYTGGSASGNNRMSIDATGNVTVANLNVAGLVANSSGGVLSTTLALPSNITATTPAATDLSTKLATTAFTGSFQNYTASGTGAATTIVIPHGLTGITGTSKVLVQPLNAASAGVSYVTVDATNINVVYTVAPANGTNNLSYSTHIKP